MTKTIRTLPETVTLSRGCHQPGDLTQGDPASLMEVVSWLDGGRWTAYPQSVSAILADMGRFMDSILPDDKRQRLLPLASSLVGTKDDGLDESRAFMALDWIIRTWAPTWLSLAGLEEEANSLRTLQRIMDLESAGAAASAVREARFKAAEVLDAARAEAWPAMETAWDASGAAALDASSHDAVGLVAWHAARAIATVVSAAGAVAQAAWEASDGSAAWDAGGLAAAVAAWAAAKDVARPVAKGTTWDAVWDVSWAAAQEGLAPTVSKLQDAAIELFAGMIQPH